MNGIFCCSCEARNYNPCANCRDVYYCNRHIKLSPFLELVMSDITKKSSVANIPSHVYERCSAARCTSCCSGLYRAYHVYKRCSAARCTGCCSNLYSAYHVYERCSAARCTSCCSGLYSAYHVYERCSVARCTSCCSGLYSAYHRDDVCTQITDACEHDKAFSLSDPDLRYVVRCLVLTYIL
jgi:hypothetical protein